MEEPATTGQGAGTREGRVDGTTVAPSDRLRAFAVRPAHGARRVFPGLYPQGVSDSDRVRDDAYGCQSGAVETNHRGDTVGAAVDFGHELGHYGSADSDSDAGWPVSHERFAGRADVRGLRVLALGVDQRAGMPHRFQNHGYAGR